MLDSTSTETGTQKLFLEFKKGKGKENKKDRRS
jgi:hypothetical protein